ncbi:MAG: NERD domain-containing protein [Chloroflexi bacterium]|nr:NERD domain-containing protein [Chloroflexota bacterium]
MTTRVFNFQRPVVLEPMLPRSGAQPRTRVNLLGAVLTALLVAPVAGAAEAPVGWLAAAASGLVMLHLAAVFGARLPWGWLTVLAAVLGLALPRGQWPLIGPALFVATAVSLAVWFAARDNRRRRRKDADRPRLGTRERTAQVMQGFSGERHVGRVLAERLPQEYVLFNGLALPRGAGDIDHLVVGPTGLFLLETKTMKGHIVCEPDGTWRRTRIGRAGTTYSAYIGDPAAQVQRNIFAVRQALQHRLPALVARTSLWIDGLVVFAHPDTRLDAGSSRVPAVVLEDATGRICSHVPRRALQPREVDLIVGALLDEGRAGATANGRDGAMAYSRAGATANGRAGVTAGAAFRQSAQALVELALALPLVVALLLGTVAVSRVVQARTAVIAVAHEVARAAALASGPDDAVTRMRNRADLVAPGLGLDARALVLSWDLSRFAADPAEVVASVEYPVNLADLPLVAGLPAVVVRADHAEWVDPFRSGLSAQPEPAR